MLRKPLADRSLEQPHPSRLPLPSAALRAHAEALAAGAPGYADPSSGLFVLTARWLADRGTCCDRGCRHCPYEPPGGADVR